jgi:BirA family transcriptional regulator, biotin operon repressor / biotin---[acetyl-CoA-carboxylase] ligase
MGTQHASEGRFDDIRRFREIDSTNTWLLAEARAGAPEGLVAVADYQTSGRGRHGRRWDAPAGSALLMSVLFRPPPAFEAARAHVLTAVVALAAIDACDEVAGFRPGLKWPNDLVVETAAGTRKLAGVLAEAELSGDRLQAVVVGLGLNLVWDDRWPPELREIATAANEVAGRPVDRDALLYALLGALDGRYQRAVGPNKWREVAAEQRDACVTLGRRVHVAGAGTAMDGGAFDGVAAELSVDGHLGVVPDDGGPLRWVTAGDVTHVRTR